MSEALPSGRGRPGVFPYKGVWPRIHPSVFVAPTASIIGDVEIGAESSVWYGAVLRGDVMPIRVGTRTSIQDNSVVHATGGWHDTIIGDEVTVGHTVIIHGCRLGSRVLVGMGSIVLDEADEIFSKLMGDVVEPRREFIERHALDVKHLDV